MKQRRKRFLAFAALLSFASLASAQRLDPVQWSLTTGTSKIPPGATVLTFLEAKIESGWHLYSPTTPKGGPIATTINVAENPAVAGSKVYQPKPERRFDPNFTLDVESFSGDTRFLLPVEIRKDATGAIELTAKVRYQACDEKQCLPPKTKTPTLALTIDPTVPAPPVAIPSGYSEVGASSSASAPAPVAIPQDQGLGRFLAVAFGLGLAAIFTPCVFPMIPITVSFFLNQKGGIFQALVFSLGIIVLFCALGLGVTAAVGPFGVVQLGSNPWVNSFIALVFGAFALSLLGAFEITLPSGLLTKLDQASRRGGTLGSLLMGLTFALTSFACVGPFVGSLLAASVQAKGTQPVLGMFSFATGLASPFFLLAAFPAYLGKMPRSGMWLARVKTVLGFVLLAAMLKYVSNVDQVLQTNWLTRERFLAAWIVLFALPGLYLLGLLRLEGVKAEEKLGIGRLLTGAAFLIFSISLIPGMLGARLGELDAYVPQSSGLTSGAASNSDGLVWMKNQYREALAKARAENRLVFVNFTGYSCTNCHWMKANLFVLPEINEKLKEFVLVELYTDGTDAASEENQKLQESKFQTVSLPYYAILDPDERVIATYAYTRSAKDFLAFLQART
jgi:thiol:disulfide interchange protein DsbD